MTKIEERIVRILGIETSCDETSAAVVENGSKLISSVVASQIDLHAAFGGVFPEMASRQHIMTIQGVIEEALRKAHMSFDDIDAIAVTRGPGLAGSLLVGVNAAKGIAVAKGLHLIGINHLEGHLYAAWLRNDPDGEEKPDPQFPLLALLVSGGHSELNLMTDHMVYQRLGGTLDDAAGEAFDKVARLLGLPYPGGPSIEKISDTGDPASFNFPRSRLEGTWNFSFSGLKTAVLRVVRKLENEKEPIPVADIAASFQAAVVDALFTKTMQAARVFKAKQILVAGGVSANKALREAFLGQNEIPVKIPPLRYCTDNAAMIGAAGYFHFLKQNFDRLDMDVMPNWPLSH